MAAEEREKLIGVDYIELSEKIHFDMSKDAEMENGEAKGEEKKEEDKQRKETKQKNETTLKLIKKYIKKDIEEITIDQSKREKLEDALLNDKADKVMKLIETGAPIDTYERDESGDIIAPLILAVNKDRRDIFSLVLQRAIREGVDDKDMRMNIALQRACTKNSVFVAKVLLKRNVNVEAIIETPTKRRAKDTKQTYNDPKANCIHFCAHFGSQEVLKLLLDKRTDSIKIDQKDSEGNTALHLASCNGYSTCVSLLIQKHAKVDEVNNDKRTPLLEAIRKAPEELIYNLIREGADVNAEDRWGLTPLLKAAEWGRDTLIPILVNNGGNVDARNQLNQTPLMLSCKSGNAAAVSELLLSGASIYAKDKIDYDAFIFARENKHDDALSVIVRAHSGDENFNRLGWHEILTKKLYKSILTMLDCMIKPELNNNTVEVNFTVLEIDRNNITPDQKEYKKEGRRKPYLLQRFSLCGNEEIAYHGVTRLLVNQKFKQYGNRQLRFKTFIFISFLAAMLYALVQAAQQHMSPNTLYRSDVRPFTGWDTLRFVCEIYVVLFWVSNIVTELAEIIQVAFYVLKEKVDKEQVASSKKEKYKYRESDDEYHDSVLTSQDNYEEKQEMEEHAEKEKRKFYKLRDYLRVHGNLIVQIFHAYFQDWYNWLDLMGIILLFILIIFRIIIITEIDVPYVEFQWIFATFAFAVNAFRLTKLLSVFKLFGTYMRIIILILLKDVPKFLLLLFLTFFFFSTTLYLSFRVPIIVGETNGTNGSQPDYYVTLFNLSDLKEEGLDKYYNVLIYPIRVLLEGNALGFNYMFNSFNIVAAVVYVAFLFLIIVVYLNVFIAQLSDTYAEVKANAKKTVAKFRLDFIIQTQTTSLLALFNDFRKMFFEKSYIMKNGEWVEYFNVGISRLDDDDFTTQEPTESLHLVVNKLQHQQKANSRTQEILQNSIEKRIKKIENQNKKILEKLTQIAQKMN